MPSLVHWIIYGNSSNCILPTTSSCDDYMHNPWEMVGQRAFFTLAATFWNGLLYVEYERITSIIITPSYVTLYLSQCFTLNCRLLCAKYLEV